MKVGFRVDAGTSIGLGHLVRCLSLAEELRRGGAICYFMCDLSNSGAGDLVVRSGHGLLDLSAEAPDEPASMDIGRTVSAIQAEGDTDWLVVDHYQIDSSWENSLREHVGRIAVIDDLARPHAADLLIDQTLDRDVSRYEGLVPASCRLFCGTGFALIRSQFGKARLERDVVRGASPIRKVLIQMGGADAQNWSEQVLSALAPLDLPIRYTVVLGSGAPWIAQLLGTIEKLRIDATVEVDVANMAALMLNNELCVGAAGSASWERCCMGLPTIMMTVADNQREVALALSRRGAAILADRLNVAEAFKRLAAEPAAMAQMSSRAAVLVDGLGASRIAAAMLE